MLIISNMKTKFINQPFSKRAMMVLAVLFTALTAGATQFITDVMVIGGSKDEVEELKTTYKAQGWTLVNNDLNAGCGSSSDFIYLLYKSEENTDGLNHGYITDFYISNTNEYNDEVTYQDRTYKLVPYKGSEHFVDIKGDLNSHAGGDFIHLYYTTDTYKESAVTSISFDYDQSNAVGNEGDSEGFDLNNGSNKATKKVYMHFSTNNAKTVNYISYTYDTTNGLERETKTCGRSKKAKSNDNIWDEGWYVVSDNVTFDKRITVSGTVNLILCDGCTLEAKKGIDLSYGNTLNIYAQSEGANAGKLKVIATSEKDEAGIGGGDGIDCGTVTIYGGAVEAHGGEDGAGIGGGYGGDGGTVTIYSGAVEAHGGDYAAGIGGGYGGSGGTVTIYGGVVEAYGGTYGAGIGGSAASGGTVTIYGGVVEAHGGEDGAGIGGGYSGSGGEVTIYGGVVAAYGGWDAAGIGAGRRGTGGTLKIGKGLYVSGGEDKILTTPIAMGPEDNVRDRARNMFVGKMYSVYYLKYSFDEDTKTLTSKERICDDYTVVTRGTNTLSDGWYVLDRSQSFDNRISVSGTVNLILCDGCTLTANKGIEVAEGNTLNIFAQSEGANAGKLKATSEWSPGIGGSSGGAGGTVTIYGGTVEARGGHGAAGIGGGDEVSGGTVTIYGGTVEAHSEYGAGIGGGISAGGTVTIYGGTVEAHGGLYGAGIGGGYKGAGGTVTVYGGTVEAHGGLYGRAGIGAGSQGSDNGTLKIGDGVKVYGGNNENPTTVIAIGPKDNVESRYRYMIAGGYVKGDANDDVRVNTADLVEMVNAKNDKASDKFVLKNADIDGSGNITQEDIDAVVKIILKK